MEKIKQRRLSGVLGWEVGGGSRDFSFKEKISLKVTFEQRSEEMRE